MQSDNKEKQRPEGHISARHFEDWFHNYGRFLESKTIDNYYPPRFLAEFDRPTHHQEMLSSPTKEQCELIATILNGTRDRMSWVESWRKEFKAYVKVRQALRAMVKRLEKRHQEANPYVKTILIKELTPLTFVLEMKTLSLLEKIYRFTETPHKGINNLLQKLRPGYRLQISQIVKGKATSLKKLPEGYPFPFIDAKGIKNPKGRKDFVIGMTYKGPRLTPQELKRTYQQSSKLRATFTENAVVCLADVLQKKGWDYPATIGQLLRAFRLFKQPLTCEDLSYAGLPCISCRSSLKRSSAAFPRELIPGVCPCATARVEKQLWKARKNRA